LALAAGPVFCSADLTTDATPLPTRWVVPFRAYRTLACIRSSHLFCIQQKKTTQTN
jgi:hypothetical protein